MTWHTFPIAPFPVNSSVILPPPLVGSDFGEVDGEVDGGVAAAAEVAYSLTRVRR